MPVPPKPKSFGFASLKSKLAEEPKVKDPGGLAADIGRKKLGFSNFQQRANAGRPGAQPSYVAKSKV